MCQALCSGQGKIRCTALIDLPLPKATASGPVLMSMLVPNENVHNR